MLGRMAKLGIEGVLSGANYRLKKSLNIHQYPTFLVFQYTNNCNSRCVMCNIWQKESKGEMSKEDIKKAFRKRVFKNLRWINLTGGEPFLRKDIVEVTKELNKLPNLEGIAIPSNGFMTDRVVESTKEMLKVLDKNKFLSITLSIDGFEKTHERIRGIKGGYKKVMKTLDELSKLSKSHSNFNVGVQPTISKFNVDEAEDFYHFIKKKTDSVGFAVMLESPGYYDNVNSEASLTKEDKLKIANLFRKIIPNDPQYGFYYSKLIEMFEKGKRGFGCMAGYKTLFMDPFGNISPCPILSANKSFSMGNINKKGSKVWFDEKATNIKKKLKTAKACETCTMMCDFINFAKVEFIEHTMFMLQHPSILKKLTNKIRRDKNPYF